MTRKEIDYQYSLARLFLDTAYLDSQMEPGEYIETLVALETWHAASRTQPDTAHPINTEPVRAALDAYGLANVEPFPRPLCS